jgi:hypothetical protein
MTILVSTFEFLKSTPFLLTFYIGKSGFLGHFSKKQKPAII